MEVGETLSGSFKSESSKRFEKEALGNVVDVLSSGNPVLTHTTEIEKLGEILGEGLISREFGHSTRKPGYEYLAEDEYGKFIMFYVGPITREGTGKNNEVGVVVRPVAGSVFTRSGRLIDISSLHYEGTVVAKDRVDPQEFLGFVLSGRRRNLKRGVVKAMQKQGTSLPIYTPAGDLLWPRQMSHEEIVRMLVERSENEAK